MFLFNKRALPERLGTRIADLYVVEISAAAKPQVQVLQSSRKGTKHHANPTDDNIPVASSSTLLFTVLREHAESHTNVINFYRNKQDMLDGRDPVYWLRIDHTTVLEDFAKGANPECFKLKSDRFSIVLRLQTREEKVLWLHTLNYILHIQRGELEREQNLSHSLQDNVATELKRHSLHMKNSVLYPNNVTTPSIYVEYSLGMFHEDNPIRRECLYIVQAVKVIQQIMWRETFSHMIFWIDFIAMVPISHDCGDPLQCLQHGRS